jgi:hypothetical protein
MQARCKANDSNDANRNENRSENRSKTYRGKLEGDSGLLSYFTGSRRLGLTWVRIVAQPS